MYVWQFDRRKQHVNVPANIQQDSSNNWSLSLLARSYAVSEQQLNIYILLVERIDRKVKLRSNIVKVCGVCVLNVTMNMTGNDDKI